MSNSASQSPKKISKEQVAHIAQLAQMSLCDDELSNLAHAFDETLDVVNKLQECQVDKVEPTHQVTGLKNVMREDRVLSKQSFSQEEALANAKETHQGYFVVPRVLEQE